MGVPPFVGAAVNVTEVPGHIAPAGIAEILIAGVRIGLTVIVMTLDVAVTGLAQVALDVIIHRIVLPFARLLFI